MSLTFLPLQTKDWFWSVSTSVSKTFNKMKNKPDANQYELSDFLNGSALVEGKPIGTFYSYKFVGLSPVNGGPMFDDYMGQPGRRCTASVSMILIPVCWRLRDGASRRFRVM